MIIRKFRFRGYRPLMQMIRAVICIAPTPWLVAIVGATILSPVRSRADVEEAIKQNVAFEDHRQVEHNRSGDRIAYRDSVIRKKCLKMGLLRMTPTRRTEASVRWYPQLKKAQKADSVDGVSS